jgi:hypothetical protein
MIICEHFHCSHRDFRVLSWETMIKIRWCEIIILRHSLTRKSISYRMICPCQPQNCKFVQWKSRYVIVCCASTVFRFRSQFSPFFLPSRIKYLFISFPNECHQCDARNELSWNQRNMMMKSADILVHVMVFGFLKMFLSLIRTIAITMQELLFLQYFSLRNIIDLFNLPWAHEAYFFDVKYIVFCPISRYTNTFPPIQLRVEILKWHLWNLKCDIAPNSFYRTIWSWKNVIWSPPDPRRLYRQHDWLGWTGMEFLSI